jgi:hypothetical protein
LHWSCCSKITLNSGDNSGDRKAFKIWYNIFKGDYNEKIALPRRVEEQEEKL